MKSSLVSLAVVIIFTAAGFHGTPLINAGERPAVAAKTLPDPPSVVLVDLANTSGTEDGTTWATAYNTIQEGISAAASAQIPEVWVKAGLYNEARYSTLVDVNTGSLVMSPNVAVYGGFDGSESVRTDRDWQLNETIIDGSTSREGSPAYHVVWGGYGARLDGFTITGGNAARHTIGTVDIDNLGGGMICWGTDTDIANCLFTGNAGDYGAGLSIVSASPDVSNCTFELNTGATGAGGLFAFNGDPVFMDCAISVNTGGYGGGAEIWSGAPIFLRCTFDDNEGNYCGAAFASNAQPEFTQCEIVGNIGSLCSGGLYFDTTSAVVTRSLFENNEGFYGGALSLWGGASHFENCVISNNSAHLGAGAFNSTSSASFLHCTLSGNTVTGAGGGIFDSDSTPTITNSILWGNSSGQISETGQGVATVSYCDVQGGWTGANINSDPLFVAGGYRIQTGSPCIDTGDPNAAIAEDFDGNPRGHDSGPDIGAYECYVPEAAFSATPTSGPAPLTVTFTDQSTDYGTPITAWTWDFGDPLQDNSDQQNPSCQYAVPGVYTVSLTVDNAVGSDTETKTDYIVVTGLPEADFSASTTSGSAPLTVSFTDLSEDNQSTIIQWAWDFGDGLGSADQNPSHAYAGAGVYTVSLTVTNGIGSDTETKTGYITVGEGPHAEIQVDFLTATAPYDVQFTDVSTPAEGQTIDTWEWTFEDSSTSSQQGPHTRTLSAGTHTVTLEITQTDDYSATAMVTFELGAGPTAAFTVAPETKYAEHEITFTDTSTSGQEAITQWQWDFGDGATAVGPGPHVHVYAEAGDYTASLTVRNQRGTDTATQTVSVVPQLPLENYPDVEVAELPNPGGPFKAGDAIASLTVEITNNSAVPCPARTDALYLSLDDRPDENDLLLDSEVTSGTTDVVFSVASMPDVAPGPYYLVVSLDDGDNVPEAAENNNVGVIAFTIVDTEMTHE